MTNDTTAEQVAPQDLRATSVRDPLTERCVRRHLRLGWWSLLLFLTLGIVLELLHGIKSGWYLDAPNEARRLMWTLAHAHGTLLSLIHMAFAAAVFLVPDWKSPARCRLASVSLTAASVLIPGGFFLGGLQIHGGDPGLGILLLPAGALCLFVAVFVTARSV